MSGGGGGGNTTTVQQSDPWSGIQPYLKSGYQQLDQAASQIPSYYPGQTYANLTPEQMQSQQMQLGYASSPAMQGTIANSLGAANYGLNSVYDPQSNPVIQQYVQSVTRPLYEAYNEQVLPGIQDQAVAAGGLGGSRQGVAQGIASRGLTNAVGDVSTGIYNNAYNTGMDQQARMMALMPQTLGLGTMPGQIYGDVGAQNQQQAQLGINEDVNRYNFNQTAPYDRYSQYLNTLQGTPWGGSSVTGPDPNASSGLSQAAGGALLGGGLAGMMGGFSMANPWMLPAVIGGGALGLWG